MQAPDRQDSERQPPAADAPFTALSALFLLSGVAGLVYQVCWQRLLFAAFGSDLASVTIVVSAFMAGLGLGALAGGLAADRWPQRALGLFAACEIGIGVYGFASPGLLTSAGAGFVTAAWPVVAAVNFMLVLLPALLMGATLPILVTYLARVWRNVGRATGQLYAMNTLGAALGAFAPAFLLFSHWRLDTVVGLAATLNVLVGLSAALLLRRQAVVA